MKILKITYLLAFICFFQITAQAQDCAYGSALGTLSTGDVTVYLPNNGSLWNDANIGAGYMTKEADDPDRDVAMIFSGGLWLGGFDPGANLKVAASTYGTFSGKSDYAPGPLTQEGITNPDDCLHFDQQWSVKKTAIEALLADFADGTIDNPIPEDLLRWPGKGNPHFFSLFGFALPDSPQGLAPFTDHNGDGIYDPEKGDVPYIKEADQATWWVFNDAGGIHVESTGNPLQMEVQVMAYSYESPDVDINNTTFYDYTFINRAIENLDSFYAAIWIDPDFGCYSDDLIGCDSENNMAFIYNEEAFDGGPGCNDCGTGVADFCGDIPMLGIKVLRGTDRIENGQVVNNGMSSFTYYNGQSNPNTAMNDPEEAIEFYRYMTGSWRDGNPFSVGGTGYDPFSTNATKYAFDGAPDDPNGWSLCSENLGPKDRRMVIGSGPSDLQPGGSTRMSFAVFKAYENNYPCPGLDKLRGVCQKVDQHFSTTTSIQDLLALPASAVRFAPNPMKDYGVIRLTEGHQLLDHVAIFSLDGRKLREANGIQATEWKVDREGLSAGMYLYRLQTTAGKWFSGKMIVQ